VVLVDGGAGDDVFDARIAAQLGPAPFAALLVVAALGPAQQGEPPLVGEQLHDGVTRDGPQLPQQLHHCLQRLCLGLSLVGGSFAVLLRPLLGEPLVGPPPARHSARLAHQLARQHVSQLRHSIVAIAVVSVSETTFIFVVVVHHLDVASLHQHFGLLHPLFLSFLLLFLFLLTFALALLVRRRCGPGARSGASRLLPPAEPGRDPIGEPDGVDAQSGARLGLPVLVGASGRGAHLFDLVDQGPQPVGKHVLEPKEQVSVARAHLTVFRILCVRWRVCVCGVSCRVRVSDVRLRCVVCRVRTS
jgi:hypothetical protein